MRKNTKIFILFTLIATLLLLNSGCSDSGGGSREIDGINSGINVSLNQIETDCSNPGITEVTAFVTVTDQDANPITVLVEDDFALSEDDIALPPGAFTVDYAAEIKIPLSVALVLDYSRSITDYQYKVDAMKDAVIGFVNELAGNDEAEIIKFASDIAVIQDFTSDKALLIKAIEDFYDLGIYTYLYDSLIVAINDTVSAPDRRAIIVLTDGINNLESGSTSTTSANDVISLSQSSGVPIFTIGLGNDVDQDVLAQIADETGGIFYHSATADNLRDIYMQLADTLILNQYVITYDSSLPTGTTSDLVVGAEFSNMEDSDSKLFTIPACP